MFLEQALRCSENCAGQTIKNHMQKDQNCSFRSLQVTLAIGETDYNHNPSGNCDKSQNECFDKSLHKFTDNEVKHINEVILTYQSF